MQVESVIVLNDYCNVQGGASRVAIDEAVALRASGAHVTFLGAVGPVSAELRDADIAVVCLDQPELLDATRHPLAASRPVWNQQAYRAMRKLMATLDRRRTIVHLHGYTKALSPSPVRAARQAGFATICTLHDFYAACPNGAFYNYRRQAPCTLRALSLSCLATNCDKRHAAHKAYRIVRGAVQRYALRFPASMKHYIALSRRSATLLRPYLPPDARLYPLANIIGVECAPPVDAGANQPLVVVGRLDEEKGVLLASLAAAQAKMPIVFVGDGPLRYSIEQTGARVTGWLPAAEVRRELDTARCLVFPSLWYEAFGLVVTEAAARGVPAIVSDISAAAERVTDGETGWVFRSGDVDDLVARMTQTRDDTVVRHAGTKAYRQYWAEPADAARHTQQLLSIYEDVVSASTGSPRARACADNSDNARAIAVVSNK